MLNVADKMDKKLPGKLMALIRLIGKTADDSGLGAFLVGGFVRDLLHGAANYDLDVVIEGDAIRFAKKLADKISGRVVTYKKFGTAVIVKKWPKWLGSPPRADGIFKIDVASARKETYKKPAALPTVRFSSLKKDLSRRDFTINAMAIDINKKDFGLFIDFFDGKEDLKKSVIRVLHKKSFIDDPTRIFRAVRFEQRFDFEIEKHTEFLIKHAVKRNMFHHTQDQRIREELMLMLREWHPEKAVFRMKELHELKFIHPALSLKKDAKKTFNNLKKCVKWYKTVCAEDNADEWLTYFMVMLEKLSENEIREVLKKFIFTRESSAKLKNYSMFGASAAKKISRNKRMRASEIYAILKPLEKEVVLYIMAKVKSEKAKRRIKKYFTELESVTLKIKGHDIAAEGVKHGPYYTELLRRVLYEKIDGNVTTKRDEILCLKKIIKENVRKFKKGEKRYDRTNEKSFKSVKTACFRYFAG
ncbi:MAG: CCA tRNA nucleotidyltransferase [Candidatus Omnitrophica bacterium]|nr:CCA tRNA nucleotidyltransferase [Candidatus Omnitrophota bacterium]